MAEFAKARGEKNDLRRKEIEKLTSAIESRRAFLARKQRVRLEEEGRLSQMETEKVSNFPESSWNTLRFWRLSVLEAYEKTQTRRDTKWSFFRPKNTNYICM